MMKKFTEQIRGAVRIELCGALPESVLNTCAVNGVMLRELECVDECTVRATVYEDQLKQLRLIAEKTMCEMTVISMRGGSRSRKLVKRRLWLLISAGLVGFLLCVSSLFIWEIDIRGCGRLNEGQVLRALADCGVEPGCFWPGMSADLVRSKMLTLLPELSWMTVNVSGSRAVVLVCERAEKPEIFDESLPRDIVAGKTGIISRVAVQSGKALVSRGQAVIEGEMLVSGRVESITNPPRFVCARGQIMADTYYEICAACPEQLPIKGEQGGTRKKFALKIGQNRINLYFGSGNDIDGCDKIIKEYNMGIEGLFATPVSIVVEELVSREESTEIFSDEAGMKERLYEYLAASIDGEIISRGYSVCREGGVLYVTMSAHCFEDIAQISEITQYDGVNLPS